MALRKQLNLNSNLGEVSSVDCYIRLKNVFTDKVSGTLQYDILRDNSDFVIETRQAYFEPDMSIRYANIWTQGYEHLKTLPEFAGAIDC